VSKPPTQKSERCGGCPYETKGQGYVPGFGPPDGRIALLGQGPGRDEIAVGRPFVGAAGRRLDIWLAKAGIPRRLCWVDNVTRCRIIVNKQDVAPAKAVAECRQRHWLPELHARASTLRYVVGIGAPAARALLGSWYTDRAAGSIVEVEL